jgi:hypothetical protein
MPDRKLFEYAVIRVVPRVEREEFLNVGVILYCRDQSFLQVLFSIDEARLAGFFHDIPFEEIKQCMISFDKICKGSTNGGPIAQLEMASRFRWLTAYRSTIVQTSRTHPGLCLDAAQKLAALYEQLVL